jgi:protein SCO1/2
MFTILRTSGVRWLPLVACAALAAACTGSPGSSSSSSRPADFVARPDATRHDIEGKVVKVDAAQRRVTLAHGAIENYMEAMTMEFAVKEAWAFEAMKPGDTVRATLIVDGARSWIEGVSVSKGVTSTVPQGAWTPPAAGTPLPEVTLTDQDAKPLDWSRFHGQPLVLTFIYTRCPLPDYCPLMMQRFAALEKALAAAATAGASAGAGAGDPALAGTRLLAISVDPAFDTPAVLRAFGQRYATGVGPDKRFTRWQLATGAPDNVKRLAGFFGLDYFEEDGQIMHALRTAIVDSHGGVYRVFEGNSWTVDEILRDLKSLPPEPTAP